MNRETYKDTVNSVQDNYERYLSNVYNKLYKDPENVGKENNFRNRSIVYVPYNGFSEKLKQDCPKIDFVDRNSPEIAKAISEMKVCTRALKRICSTHNVDLEKATSSELIDVFC
jgi:hypothetical protein